MTGKELTTLEYPRQYFMVICPKTNDTEKLYVSNSKVSGNAN